jgi:hypothetical protein
LAWRCARLATTTTRDGAACFEAIQQQPGQQEVADMADAKGQLETGFREALLAGQPGVVDQQVQRQLAGVEGLGALAHAVQVAEVQRDELGPGRAAAALGDFVEHLGGLARVIFPARSAFVSMKSRRGSTSSPISMVNTRSASMASSICTRSRRRTVGSMVVSHSCSGFISPRPL